MEQTRKIDEVEFLRLLTGGGAATNTGSYGNRRAKGYARRRKRNKATRSEKNY